MPIPLFRITSTLAKNLNLRECYMLKLPHNVETWAAEAFIEYINDLPSIMEDNLYHQGEGSMTADLQLHSAAQALGMSAYTQHFVNYYWGLLCKKKINGYGDLDGLTALNTRVGISFFNKAVSVLSEADKQRLIKDVDDFEAYLASNTRVRDALDAKKDVSHNGQGAKGEERSRHWQKAGAGRMNDGLGQSTEEDE